jgi:hypothetical protein
LPSAFAAASTYVSDRQTDRERERASTWLQVIERSHDDDDGGDDDDEVGCSMACVVPLVLVEELPQSRV